jgi:hypothetical protein
MNTTKPDSEQKDSVHQNAASGSDTLTDAAMIDFASALDDFQGEEVVDKHDTPVGTLGCYWQSVSGLLVFLGIKLKGQEDIRVVPGRPSQVDDRHACIRLGFEGDDIESAPPFDCASEMDTSFERRVYEHFHVSEAQPHDGLRYFARSRRRSSQSAASIGVEDTDETRSDELREET